MLTPNDKLNLIKTGQRVIVSDQDLDSISLIDDDSTSLICSIPNPSQVGMLDQYIAWMKEPRQ